MAIAMNLYVWFPIKKDVAVENAALDSKLAKQRKTAGLPGVLEFMIFFNKLHGNVLKMTNILNCPDKF